MKYRYVTDYDWFPVSANGDDRTACCDCGLVHNFNFKTVDGEMTMQVVRNNRATSQVRRYMKRMKEGLFASSSNA